MQRSHFTKDITTTLMGVLLLLLGATAVAQQTISLTAAPTPLTLPDGSTVPMWGYACSVQGSPATGAAAQTCGSLNPASTGWSPVILTVPSGQDLNISLTNNLSFKAPDGSTNNIPTSIVIVGQLGGGLGNSATTNLSPTHENRSTTWPITDTGAVFVPPQQPARVQSFATEVAGGSTSANPLVWKAPRPGTYLLESGTHPSIQVPMGLYGIVVVTSAPNGATAGTAYTNVSYNAELPLLFSEIDPAQNNGVDAAVKSTGFNEAATLGPYSAQPLTSVLLVNGGSGYTSAPAVQIVGGGCASDCGSVTATIDTDSTSPTFQQVVALNFTAGAGTFTTAPTIGFSGGGGSGAKATAALKLAASITCRGPEGDAGACYPPAVNYTPLYYMINGQAFDKTNVTASLFNAMPAPGTSGTVLVRMVNAGLRMHVPSIVGAQTGSGAAGFSLIAEDGNALPGVPRVQSEVFMAAGKTYDVMINVPAAGGSALPVFDRELSLSANSTGRDAGMLAYIGVNGAGIPNTGVFSSSGAIARNDNYPSLVAGHTFSVSDPSQGVIANDANVIGVQVLTPPVNGRLTLNRNGTFTYVPSANGISVALTNGGSGYTAPVVVIDPPPSPGTQAQATASISSGVITGITVTYIGSGYTTAPAVHISDTTGTAATATASIIAGNSTSDTFVYQANGNPAINATVTLGAATIEAATGITCDTSSFTSTTATYIAVKTPGVLAKCTDAAGYPLTVDPTSIAGTGVNVSVDANGGFTATVTGAPPYSFTFVPVNSQGTKGTAATANLTFLPGSGLTVTVLDGADKKTQITDYRWIIEEDRTFYMDPACTTNPLPNGCPTATSQGTPLVFGMNFHTSFMPVVATGCTGPLSCEANQTLGGQQAVCDQGDGICRLAAGGKTQIDPSQVHLDPTKRYYISVMPGDASNPFNNGYAQAPLCSFTTDASGNQISAPNSSCGHGMGGAPVVAPCFTAKNCSASSQFANVPVITQPSPYPPAKLTVFVFEDDYPLNGEHDAGGGVDVLSPNEPGLGGFEILLADDAGGTGDATGQPTYDMFNMPLTNSLAGTIDPVTQLDACPISTQVTQNATKGDGSQKGIVGMVVTCPYYESDGATLSPLAGQAVIANLYPGRYGVIANPGADRIAGGEEWLQTNTLDGQKAHDSFMRIGEPAYFQEFGPAGYHVTIGFANPKVIAGRLASVCPNAAACNNSVKGHVTTARMSRTPDQRLYGSGSRDEFSFTQCYVSLGDPDGPNFGFAKCDDQGNFQMSNLPPGNWKLVIFDQWNDQIVDGISIPVALNCSNTLGGACTGTSQAAGVNLDLGEIASHQWQSNIYTRTFIDLNGDGVSTKDNTGTPCTAPNTPAGCNPNYGNDLEPGLALAPVNNRYRDGSFSNFNNTDLNGYANYNEIFPLFNWYVIETDESRYKTTGVHVVYDAGGPTDGTAGGGNSTIGSHFANTQEIMSLPTDLRIPGAAYCESADCTGVSIANPSAGPSNPNCVWTQNSSQHGGTVKCDTPVSTGRIDPPFWFGSYAWQGFAGQSNFLEFGKTPYVPGETGGIHGHVVYASTRPYDDPQMMLQNSWEPLVPHVRVNLYKEGVAADGTESLTLIDHTDTSSFDDWVQGFRADGKPNISCPGQLPAPDGNNFGDPFFFGLENQPYYLDWYNNVLHGSGTTTSLPYQSQFKCYDGMHNWNQIQPAPYDGMYSFPSATGFDPTTGKPSGTNCTACGIDPDKNDPYRYGMPMLPAGKYVVEVVVPPGYELVKEEDKNILIGDNFIAPVTQQFAGLGNIFILPDQAAVSAAYNQYNPQNQTTDLGVSPIGGDDATKTQEYMWPCVGELRTVPDLMSIFPQSGEVAPFAGAQRHLCDRKEVTLVDQTQAQAKFYIFTPTHAASHFTGIIMDDFTAEFDPYSPQFGEKFAPSYLPVSLKDWTGTEVNRVYSDMFGLYNGLNYSTWEVNPPNPTGYAPTMMVTCMNDPGNGATPDPLYQPNYSNFCYELAYMPGQTGYFDTPVTPTSAFSEGYNHPDCNYPDQTPAIASVTSQDIAGPWVSVPGRTITINALGDQMVDNYGYTGPQSTNAPFNQQKINRHYGFGGTQGTVTVGGVPLTNVNWSDTAITGTVNLNGTDAKGNSVSIPQCSVQQQAQYSNGAPTSYCGQLLITNANGQQSVDTVTVTLGGKMPIVLGTGQTIQSALDAANPGDMIILPQGVYHEMLIMWKPVRLQGVGAASSIVNANTHPAGKLDPWRKEVVCLFGLTPDGRPSTGPYAGCPGKGWTNLPEGTASFPTMIVDRVTLEAVLGWDANLNGNLAEQLIEPSLMGAYEGAAITVLGKGVNIPSNATDPFGSAAATAASFPTGTVLLTAGDCTDSTGTNPYPSNFYCNPSSIDGLTLSNSSQGGGGIFVHAWGHNLQIANNRVTNNTGTMSGGITVGQGEHIDVLQAGVAPLDPPNSCETGTVPNQALPFCYDVHVNVHNNSVTMNSSLGDELFSSTPAGAGGVSFCNGADYYKFNYNWVCGNMSTGDGGGFAHIGFIKNGDIEHNSILFNQSTNPTITTNGGGLLVMGAPDIDPNCAPASNPDQDCVPNPTTVTPSNGTGPGLVINANLILGNAADSGSGGGLRLQQINGTDVTTFPNGQSACPTAGAATCLWNSVNVTNNIIANNVAGWDGGGVSLQDAMAVNIVNNTIVSNDSTASSGTLFGSLFAPLASNPGVNCTTPDGTYSCPQVAGLVSITHGAILAANMPANVTCPPGHKNCATISDPLLANNVIWQNRSFVIGVGGLGSASQAKNQQNVVTLYNAAFPTSGTTAVQPTTQPASQTVTGQCVSASYWDIGVRGDLGPALRSSGFTLAPTYSVLTDATTDYTTGNNLGSNPNLTSQYCNGSRVPPENGSAGYMVYPGTNETAGGPISLWLFQLTPSATVDEGNNWINMRWGPLALANPSTGAVLGNFAPSAGSAVIDYVPLASAAGQVAPSADFFGNPRPNLGGANVDVGAIEFQPVISAKLASITLNPPPSGYYRGYTVNVTLNGTNLAGATAVNTPANSGVTCTVTGTTATTVNASCVIANTAPLGSVSITVTPGSAGGGDGDEVTNAVQITVVNPPKPALSSINPTSGIRGTSIPVTLTGTSLLTTSAINVTGNGITVTNIVPQNDTTVTATFQIAGNATLTQRTVSVTTLGGNSSPSTVTFTVAAAPTPVLSSITPTSGARNSTVPVTLKGTFLTGATAINISGPGVTATGLTVVNDTTVTATFTISGTAALTTRTVTITTPGGTSNAVPGGFTVAGASLTSLTPNTGARGTSVPVTFSGVNLTGTTGINGLGGGLTLATGSLQVVNSSTVTATLNLSATATVTTRALGLATPSGNTNTESFTIVVPPAPTFTSVTPTTGVRGTAVPVQLVGSNFTNTGVTVAVAGGGVTVSGVTIVDSSHINATFTITATAVATARDVTVTTPGGSATLTGGFTVQGPTLASITPNPATRSSNNLPLTFAGTNLSGATAVTGLGPGVTVVAGSFSVADSSHVTVRVNIAAGASTTAVRNAAVTTNIGTTNTVLFTLQ